jgi:TetR/AcrR family transcriptional regulator, cholesterol catabolism regulator
MIKVETKPRSRGRRRASSAQFAARRNEIVDLAAHLFAKNGYAATGIREIGDAAELARGALYYYIDSKESLLGEIHNRVMDPLLEQAQSIASLRVSATSRIRLVSEVLMRQIIDHQDHVWVFLHEYRSLTGDRRDTFRKKRAEFEALLMQLFTQGVDNGEFAIDDIRGTMLAFLGMHNYTYQWIHGELLPDPVALSELYCSIFFHGVLRDPHAPSEGKDSPGLRPESGGSPQWGSPAGDTKNAGKSGEGRDHHG